MTRFSFGVDGEDTRRKLIYGVNGWVPYDEYPDPPRRPDGSGVKMTPFGKEINGIPITEMKRIDREARERLNKIEQDNWKHLAARCGKISTYDTPGKRRIIAQTLFMGLHDGDPPDLEEYAAATGNPSLEDAADELSPVGGFEEKPYGIVTPEIHFDNDDIPEPTEDDDGDDFVIASVEA